MATSPNYRSGSRRGGQYRSGQGRDVYRQERNGYVYGDLAHQLEEIPERRKTARAKKENKDISAAKAGGDAVHWIFILCISDGCIIISSCGRLYVSACAVRDHADEE